MEERHIETDTTPSAHESTTRSSVPIRKTVSGERQSGVPTKRNGSRGVEAIVTVTFAEFVGGCSDNKPVDSEPLDSFAGMTSAPVPNHD